MSQDFIWKKQINPNDFILFDEVVVHKKYPRFVEMQRTDPHFPPNSILARGDQAVRSYWNGKNIRKRAK